MRGDEGGAPPVGPAATRGVPWDLDEDDLLLDARGRGEDMGCVPIEAAEGASLFFLATVLRARAVVEIGTGVGVSGLYLLRGMVPAGVLTTIDIESQHQRCARTAFRADGHAAGRVRLINGRALDVLPRLTDGVYDLVYADAEFDEYPHYLRAASRLLRPGGVVALSGALPDAALLEHGPAAETFAVREVQRMCREDDALVVWPQPLGTGLLVAARR